MPGDHATTAAALRHCMRKAKTRAQTTMRHAEATMPSDRAMRNGRFWRPTALRKPNRSEQRPARHANKLPKVSQILGACELFALVRARTP